MERMKKLLAIKEKLSNCDVRIRKKVLYKVQLKKPKDSSPVSSQQNHYLKFHPSLLTLTTN
jgi:hypothetical protein